MNLETTYVHLRVDRRSTLLPVTETFWRDLDGRRDLDPGQLVMGFSFSADWPTWEMHPAGDEVVTLLSGEATLVLQHPEGAQRVQLSTPGDFVVVPRGVWHTAQTTVPCRMLFVTPGEGTENRAHPP